MTQPPANWYPDPSDPASLRYWDGAAWTEHTSPALQGPAAPPRVGPTTPDGVPLAGWWWRVLALVIDSFLIGIIGQLLTMPFTSGFNRDLTAAFEELETSSSADSFSAFWDTFMQAYQDHALALFLPGFVLTLGYHALMLRFKGATLGKAAVGLKVRLRDHDGPLSWSTIALRLLIPQGASALVITAFLGGSLATFLALVLASTALGWLDGLWAAWDPRRQAIHDKLARTNVVKVR